MKTAIKKKLSYLRCKKIGENSIKKKKTFVQTISIVIFFFSRKIVKNFNNSATIFKRKDKNKCSFNRDKKNKMERYIYCTRAFFIHAVMRADTLEKKSVRRINDCY